jgi:hypothetical protein
MSFSTMRPVSVGRLLFTRQFGGLKPSRKSSDLAARAAEADLLNSVEVYKRGVVENIVNPFTRLVTTEVTVRLPFVILGGFSMVALMQAWYGTQDNPYQPVFEEKFVTKKDPEAIVDFYQAEELLNIIAVHPIFFNLFMNKVDFDTAEMTEDTALLRANEAEGTAGVEAEVHLNVKGLGMEVSFEIIKQEEEIDGEEVLTHFCRHERFIDWVPFLNEMGVKIMLWDQTWKFMLDRQEDGSYKVTHKCTKFIGPFPVRVIVYFHQKYVVWACEKYINKTDFGVEDADLDIQHELLSNVPAHLAKAYSGMGLTDEQRRGIVAMYEDPSTEFWRLEAISSQRPGWKKYIKPAPPMEAEEESDD